MNFFTDIYSSFSKLFSPKDRTEELTEEEEEFEFRPRIVSFGNVLLDYTLKLKAADAIEPYGLTIGKQGEISSELLNKIAVRFNLKNGHPGGSALNTTRIIRKIGYASCLFFGAVGDDENGKYLKKILKKKGINASLQVVPNKPTGQCICFVHKEHTGLYANIGASADFSVECLKAYDQDAFRQNDVFQQVFYVEGFFLPHRYSVCEFIIKEYIGEFCHLAFNLSAPYIILENFGMVKTMVDSALVIFGNKAEFLTLAKLFKFDTIMELTHSYCLKYRKVFVITNGAECVELYTNYEKNGFYRMEWNVPHVNQEVVKDTTGAGDAFVAGFLSAFVGWRDLMVCISDGCTEANKVIKQIGCDIP